MNRLEDSPLFQSLNTLIDRLTEIWGSGKGEPSVGEILSTARAIEQIGEAGERFPTEMGEVLGEKASEVEKESALQGVQEQLSEIVAQCKGEAQTPLRQLIASLGKWRDGFLAMLEEIEAAGALQQAQIAQMAEELRRLQPSEPNSIRRVRDIHKQVKSERKHKILVGAVNQLETEKVPSAIWLKAMFSHSYLVLADRKNAPVADVLAILVSKYEEWCKKNWNFDAVSSWLFDSLKDVAEDGLGSLSTQDIYDFFFGLQQALGDSRHFRLEIILSRLSLELAKFNSPESGHLENAWSHAKQALALKPKLEEAAYLKKLTQQRMREVGIEPPISFDDEEEEDKHGFSSATPTPQRRKQAEDTLRQTANRGDNQDSTPLIDLVLGYMNDPEVGSWLVYKLVKENEPVTLSDSDRRALVTRAKSLLREPSVEMFLSEVEVLWGEDENYRQEGGLDGAVERSVLEDIIRERAAKKLDALYSRLKTAKPWCALACFDCLSKQEPDNLEVLWYRAFSAKALQRKSDYLESALPCLNRVPSASPAAVANALLSFELHGLALAVAELDSDSSPQGVGGIVQLAAQQCQMEPWEWPLVLQKATAEFEKGSWVDAAELIVRAMLASPTHWESCRAFLEIFTHPGDAEQGWGDGALALALAVLQYLNRQRLFREQPELLVLEAQLRLKRAALESQQLPESVREECAQLCSRALRSCSGFAPAIEFQEHLKPDPILAPGETFCGCYRILEVMPKGSFGQVYKALVIGEKLHGQETVALKKLCIAELTPEKRQERLQLLQQEADTSQRLEHPHIVKTYDFISEHRCLVMEFIDGETLAEKIDKDITLPWQSAAKIGGQISDALRYAGEKIAERDSNESNFAHRDIHPGNIMVMGTDENPDAKLLDFGLARVPGGTRTTVALADIDWRNIYRAPDYGKNMDFRADMFALGVILYELISGQCPYPVDKYDEYKNKHIDGSEVALTLRPLGQILSGSDTPKKLEAILLKMVAFRKEERYNSWESLIADLDGLLNSDSA